MAFPPSFLEEIRTRVPLAGIIGKRVRLQRRGKEHVGLCPFHEEKTPSFTVVEDKGFFHCFGCHAHGDVIGFVMRSENLSFPEAVERLANQAGLSVPQQTPEARERARRAATLHEVLEEACNWYQERLAGPSGKDVRDYLEKRGVTRASVERFRLGYAPDGRDALIRHLTGKGVASELITDAGLSAGGDDGRKPVDRFRHRLMFPIGDRGGRIIAFGGRAMGDHKAKYLNSPETQLFHKGRVLYGYAQARRTAQEAGTVIVVEGYMDVIALSQAGFGHAVAPLGTALTEHQLALLWRLADEPILCFDGDEAGNRAAHRAVDQALPDLVPDKSVRFAMIPGGADPDDLVRLQGAGAMKDILDRAMPLMDMLWRSRTGNGRFDTPERRAGLELDLQQSIARIGDHKVQQHYRNEIRERMWKAFGPTRRGGTDKRRRPWVPPGSRGWDRVRGDRWSGGIEPRPTRVPGAGAASLREHSERNLIAFPVLRTGLLERVADRLAEVPFVNPDHDRARNSLLDVFHRSENLDTTGLQCHLTSNGLSGLLGGFTRTDSSGETDPMLDPVLDIESVDIDKVEEIWVQALEFHQYRYVLNDEMRADAEALGENQSDEAWERLRAKWESREDWGAKVLAVEDDGDPD